MEQRVAQLAGALARHEGIGEGDRIASLGQNTPELLELLFACARLGAILVPLSARMPAPELEVVLANTEPVALLAENAFAQTAREAGSALELKVIPFETLPALLEHAPERPWDSERALRTLAISAPAMTKALISHPRWEATDLSSLRCVITGSTIVREDALTRWFQRGVCVLQDDGLTEAMLVVAIVPREGAHRLRATAGRPVPHCRVRIAAPDGSPVQSGEVGEVLVQGPTVMPEYWRNPDATSDAFHADGWLRTGDAGSFDAEGMLSIVDRIKEVIIVGSLQRVSRRCPVGAGGLPGDRGIRRGGTPGRRPRRGAGRVRGAAATRDDERRQRQGPVRGAARRVQAPAGRDLHRCPAAQCDRQGPGGRASVAALSRRAHRTTTGRGRCRRACQ